MCKIVTPSESREQSTIDNLSANAQTLSSLLHVIPEKRNHIEITVANKLFTFTLERVF